MQSINLHPITLSSILILSSHLRLSLPSGLYPCGFPTEILQTFFSPMRVIFHPRDFIILTIWRSVQVTKLFIMQLSPFSYHFILLRPSFLLSTLFPYTLNLCSSPNIRDQVSHPQKIKSYYSFFTLIFVLLEERL
jgi:hypothetical protein